MTKKNNNPNLEISRKELSEMIAQITLSYLVEEDDLSEKQVQVEESIGKKIIGFCKNYEINLAQVTVNWNPADKINSYLIRLFIDNNEKYVGLLFDESLNYSNSVNLQENFFTIGDEKDKMFFRLVSLIIGDANFMKEMIDSISSAIAHVDDPEEIPEPDDDAIVQTSKPEEDDDIPEEDALEFE